MLVVDAHLDLAYNALRGRDITRPAAEQPVVESDQLETATVGLPDLRRAGVALACTTLFCAPATPTRDGYSDHAGAFEQARRQLDIYHQLQDRGLLRIIGSRHELPKAEAAEPSPEQPAALFGLSDQELMQQLAAEARRSEAQPEPLGAIVLMEGADAMCLADEGAEASAAAWFEAGVRIVGLAWGRTRFAGGTGAIGGLTPAGRRLVRELEAAGFIHDASHLAEEALEELLAMADRPICATHSNCRALIGEDPRQRHLSDRMIRRLAAGGGVIGAVLLDRFLLPQEELARRRATWADVVRHIDHICQLTGDCQHVGLGSDLDGGFGREQVPRELADAGDLPQLADALSTAGFGDEDVVSIMGGNWLRFFGEWLGG